MATNDPDLDELLAAALSDLPRDPVERRRAFAKMIEEARAEAEREGTYTIDEVAAEMDAIIAGKP